MPRDLQLLARGNFDHISLVAALRFDTGDPQQTAMATSSDGNIMAVHTVKGDVFVWSLKAGHLVTSFRTLSEGAYSSQTPCLALSSDGSLLAATSLAGSPNDGVGVWSLDRGDTPIFRSPPLTRVRAVFLSPNGDRLAVIAENGGRVLVYDVQSGDQVASNLNLWGEVIRSADGTTLGGRTTEGAWASPWADGKEVLEVAGSWEHADLSADGSLLAVVDGAGTIAAYDVASRTERWRLSTALGRARAMALSPDERFVAVAFSLESSDYLETTLVIWRTSDGHQVLSTQTHLNDAKLLLRFSPDGRILAAANPGDGILLIREIPTGYQDHIPQWVGREFDDISFSSDSGLLFRHSQGRLQDAWDVLPGGTDQDYPPQLYLPRGARLPFLLGGRLLATVSEAAIRLWGDSTVPLTLPSADDFQVLTSHDTDRIELVSRVRLQGGTDLAFSPDGAQLAVGHEDGSLTLFDMKAQERESWSGHSDRVFHVAFSPAGDRFATASKDGTLRVWNVANRSLMLDYNVAPAEVTAVAYSPDGSLLAMAWTRGAIGLLDAATGRMLRVLQGHNGRVTDLAFSPVGQLLGSISEDDTVRLWNPGTGDLAWTSGGLGSQLAFSPDGTLLATDQNVWRVPERKRRPVDDLDHNLWYLLPVLFWPDGGYLSTDAHLNYHYLLPLPHLRSAVFSPDGRLLAAVSDDGWLCFLGIWR